MVKPPCKDCKDRAVGCHASCSKYIEFTILVTAEREAEREAKRYDELGYTPYRKSWRRGDFHKLNPDYYGKGDK